MEQLDTPDTPVAAHRSLAGLQLFNGVAASDIAPLLAHCPVLQLRAGAILDTAHAGAHLYIVLRGALGETDGASGNPDGPATKILPGECVGELSVLDDEAVPGTIRALEDSEVLAIDAATLWKLIDESNGVARNLLRLLSFRVRAANAQIRKRQRVGEFYRQLSMVDGLTNLQNRAWLNEHLPALIGTAHALDNPLSLIMADIDHFKRFNDTYGHQAGDDALRAAAGTLQQALRPRDHAVRYGGEELMVLLPNTNHKAARIVAQRLCERLRGAVVFADMRQSLPHITASFGIATLCAGQDAAALIAEADRALYRAKQAGRDRIEVA